MENKVKPGKAVCLFPGFFLFYSLLRSASHPFSVVPQGCFLICPASFSAAPHGCFHFGFTLLFRSSLKDKHDLHQSPDSIEHAEYHDAHVCKDREPHVGDADRPQQEADGFHSDSESYIFMDDHHPSGQRPPPRSLRPSRGPPSRSRYPPGKEPARH